MLKNFIVPPAPSGSLDATLASAGLPLLALDLRASPEWFRQARRSRQIGAVYSEGAPYAFMSDIVPAAGVRRCAVRGGDHGSAKEFRAVIDRTPD